MAKATNCRVDIPQVFQRFSITLNLLTQAWLFLFFVFTTACMQLCMHALCHAHMGVKLSRSAGVFAVTVRTAVCSLCICVSLVCSCVQIQSDALSTKGVKINVLFTFILTVTQQAFKKKTSEEFAVTFFSK